MARGFPSMTALLGLLAIAGYQNRDKITEMLKGLGQPGAKATGGLADLLSSLGGKNGAGAGGLLSGGLAELIERFQETGKGDLADSWVASGPNKDIAPGDLERAIGPDVLAALSQQTGLSREVILERLSRELPAAVDKYTPDGRLPS